jgi:translation elongation factor EF-1alpha
LLGELQSKRTDLENDSFDHSKEIASHHKEIGYHTSNVNEGTEMATLKSLSEAFSGILQAAKDKANTPPKKKYGERDGDEDDKKTYSGALGDALGIKAKKEPSKGDLTRGEMKGVGKVRRHVCTEGVDFTVYQVGTKFVAQIVEGEEVVFECAAPTEAGAIAQTNRIIEQTLEACAETQVASVEAAKSVAKKVTSK